MKTPQNLHRPIVWANLYCCHQWACGLHYFWNMDSISWVSLVSSECPRAAPQVRFSFYCSHPLIFWREVGRLGMGPLTSRFNSRLQLPFLCPLTVLPKDHFLSLILSAPLSFWSIFQFPKPLSVWVLSGWAHSPKMDCKWLPASWPHMWQRSYWQLPRSIVCHWYLVYKTPRKVHECPSPPGTARLPNVMWELWNWNSTTPLMNTQLLSKCFLTENWVSSITWNGISYNSITLIFKLILGATVVCLHILGTM